MDETKTYIEMCIEALEIQKTRQDQLQELVWDIDNENNLDYLLACFCIDSEDKHLTYYQRFKTLEQRWLAFVMCTKYRKKWDNETKKWIYSDKFKKS